MIDPETMHVTPIEVTTELPAALAPLSEVARNYWWSWQPKAWALFQEVDPELWSKCQHNPVKLLDLAPRERLENLADDRRFLASVQAVRNALQNDLDGPAWFAQQPGGDGPAKIAYFCAEFGITESFQIYSGGLGCLAGDHLKSASELGVPLTAVGLLYRRGYFQQHLSADGWQMEYNPELDFERLPLERVKAPGSDDPLTIDVDLPGRSVAVAVWRTEVGRVPLYLLDTDLEANRPNDRRITNQLYGGDQEHRIQQEIVLGIAGHRALEALGLRPDICHLNEGHAAFVALERIRRLLEDHPGLSFDEARQMAAASHVFTTHTPVPAGIDRFPSALVEKYFRQFHPSLHLDMEGVLALGRDNVFDKTEPFSMATLAIRTSDFCNGVSKLHGEVSRDMWKAIWPGVPAPEVPIGHVTNGVHAKSWLHADLAEALAAQTDDLPKNASLDAKLDRALVEPFEAVRKIPDEELWRIHQECRKALLAFCCKVSPVRPEHLGPARHYDAPLDPQGFTVGFARRFATYKRGALFLQDPERLLRLVRSETYPVQFVIAGKAHPADFGGKELIQRIVRFADDHDVAHRIVFVENYDIHVARMLVQGCDIWLNNPRRGMEASGTSGMKSAMNGVPNCSILDGWWDEAYEPEVGWAIGGRMNLDNEQAADRIESRALYNLLEQEIVPEFYDRDANGVPRAWVQRMKASIARLGHAFSTNRMVQDYATRYYLPAIERATRMASDDLAPARELARCKGTLRYAWPAVRVRSVAAHAPGAVRPDHDVDVVVEIEHDGLNPADLRVQACIGEADSTGALGDLAVAELDLNPAKNGQDGISQYTGRVRPDRPGRFGLCVRVLPACDLPTPVSEPGLIRWHGQVEAAPAHTAAAPAKAGAKA
ncbi:MAG: alpha-glucan family phosphorylase [Planctomycetota bacterium]